MDRLQYHQIKQFLQNETILAYCETKMQQSPESLLQTKILVTGDEISCRKFGMDQARPKRTFGLGQIDLANKLENENHAQSLLASLPGFQGGRLGHLARNLRHGSEFHVHHTI